MTTGHDRPRETSMDEDEDPELLEDVEEDPHERCNGIHGGGAGEHYTCDGQEL